ncbi:MAG TPA: hypothetical protein VGS02_01830 [Acidobacteriaceae bacterium]|nr:hypothetical protein [Acidobacteriaceae bacterium]
MARSSSTGKSMNKRPPVSNSRKPQRSESQSLGGREFGEVVEPMQAQMASGNEGLAETSPGVNPARTTRRTKRAA